MSLTGHNFIHHQALWRSSVCHRNDHPPIFFHLSVVCGVLDAIDEGAVVSGVCVCVCVLPAGFLFMLMLPSAKAQIAYV